MTTWHMIVTMVWQGAVRTVVSVVVGAATTALIINKIRCAWSAHIHTQRVIADRLDTRTPGGLGDLVKK